MNINDIIAQKGVLYDRYLGTPLSLPYSDFETIKIKQNDTANNFNLNNIISKIHENYLYLYKVAHIASNIMPLTSISTIGVVSPSGFSAYQGLSTSQFTSFASVGISNFDNCNVLSVKYNSDLAKYVIFGSSGPNLVVLNSNDTLTSATTALSTTSVSIGSNIKWSNIQDFTFGDNNEFYVLDQGANSVVKYDATGLLTDDNILQNMLVYQGNVGGRGTFDDNTKFNVPTSIDYYNSELYVLDSGNSCIKKYDTNLNWITTYRLFRDFLSAYPIQINHDNNGNVYVVTKTNSILKYNEDFTVKTEIDLNTLTGDTGKVKQIVFSSSDTNVFYLFTDSYIYKSLLSNPDDIVGKYSLSRFGVNTQETISNMSSVAKNINGIDYDYNFIFSSSSNIGKISVYEDSLNAVSVLTNDIFDIYTIDELSIHPEEYLQSWVINKTISKLLINHMRLRDNITSKLLYQKDAASGDILLTGTRYLTEKELNKIHFYQDITKYIGMNELFQNNIVNRPFQYIHEIQINLLSMLNAEIQNYLSKSQVVELN